MTDPDFTIRLLGDAGGNIAAWFDFLKTVTATLVGGLLAFFTARLSDRARAREERRTLAAAAAAELEASRAGLEEIMRAAREWDPEHNKDTMDYGAIAKDPTPLVRAAYEKAGAFPPKVATALARYMMLQRQFRQQVNVMRVMREKNVLTEAKETGRRVALNAIALQMIDAIGHLRRCLDDYSRRRPWWNKNAYA